MHDPTSVTPPSATGEYLWRFLSLRGATMHEASIARVIGAVLEQTGPAHLSTERIQRECLAAGVRAAWSDAPPAYGTIARVLDLLRSYGLVAWTTAYVFRWHFDRAPMPEQPRPVRHADGSYRLRARFVALVAVAAGLSMLASAPEARSIESPAPSEADASLPTERAQPTRERPGLSIERASGAEASIESPAATATRYEPVDLARVRAWRPPD